MASKLPGGLQNVSRQAVRIAKNYTKGYSDMQTKVRDATSNDPWGPSGAQMNEIAQATYNQQDFIEIMEQMDRRMNDKGKNWRHVFKALTVLDYILHNGSDNTVLYFQENIYIVKTLREFEYVDEQGKDQGANVRQKAKDIVNLLLDDKRMKAQRRQRSDMRDRMNGRDRRDSDEEDESVARARANMRRAQERPPEPEDDDLARALAESKRSADADADRLKRLRAEEDDLAKAIRMSQEDDERRRRELANNRNGLFDAESSNNNSSRPNDGWDSLLDAGQPMQPQPTGFASFNPYAAQQQQQQQEEWMRQQQLMEMQRQQLELQAQMQAAAQAQAEHEAYQQMLMQQQMQQQQLMYQQQMAAQQQSLQPLIPQTTSIGSNNPFAAFSQPAPAKTPSPQPQPAPLPVQVPQAVKPPKDDGKYSHLASLLGNRDDGVDTFGNVGALRYGRHAPGGTNPFNRQQQQQPQQQQQNQQPLFEL